MWGLRLPLASLGFNVVLMCTLCSSEDPLNAAEDKDLEPVNRINISAIVTNAESNITDVYVETENGSQHFQQQFGGKQQLTEVNNQPPSLTTYATSTPDRASTAESISKDDLPSSYLYGDGPTTRTTSTTSTTTSRSFRSRKFSRLDKLKDSVLSDPSKFITVNYIATVAVKDLVTGVDYSLWELHSREEESIKLILTDPRRNATSSCQMHTGGFGHATTGVRCRISRNLPQDCFCWDGLCLYPYYPISMALKELATKGGEISEILETGPEDSEDTSEESPSEVLPILFRWEIRTESLEIRAVLRLVNNLLYPLELELSGLGYALGSKDTEGHIHLSVVEFQPEDIPSLRMKLHPNGGDLLTLNTDPGIFCPRTNIHPPRSFPELPNQFSVRIETVVRESGQVTYAQHNYDLQHKLVSVKVSPRPHNPPSIFLTTLALAPHLLPHTSTIIHDFNTGLQYTLEERTGNCSVEAIPDWLGDAVTTKGRPVRLKLASELIQVSPSQFVYSGKRQIRGITADVWTSERLGETENEEYSTIELFFSDSSWTVQLEEVNELKHVPLGMATYYADSRTAPYFHTKVMSHYHEFSANHPSWKKFDISHCLSNADRLYLRLTLQVSYGQLVQFSLATAQDSIRASLARQGKVSPLRVVELFLSSARNNGGVDVWFVLLEKPEISMKNEKIKITEEGTLAETYKTLALSFRHESKLRLELDRERSMLVGVKAGSLEVVSESTHPAARNKSYLFLRTHYTAGSMAGLGFSMAVLGLSIGILVGFLLWKRRLGLPPFLHLPHLHVPSCQATPILSSPAADLTQMSPAYPGPPLSEPRF